MNHKARTGMSAVIARYIEAAMPVASADLRQGELIGMPTGKWKAAGNSPGHFQREEAIRVSWVIAIDHRKGRLHELQAYHDAVAFVEANDDWRKQFGGLVGTWQSRGRLDLDQFLDGCLGAAMSALAEKLDPVEAALRRASETETFLNSSEVRVETFAPLLGFNAFGLGRVELTPDLVIDPLDADELERLFHVGLVHPTMPTLPFVWVPSHIVRSSYRTPKVVGEVELPQDVAITDPGKPAQDAIDELIVCLRLFKPGIVGIAGTATQLPPPYGGFQWGGGAWHPAFGRRMPIPGPFGYEVAPSEVPELVELWQRLHSPGFRASQQLGLAARRFSYKGERTRVDDQLVDLIVAAEALFLGDSDDESRGELRYRLSSRAAWYIAGAGQNRVSVFKTFMGAYRMRSRLVHGTDARPITVVGEEFTPERMVEVLERLLRLALNQAVRDAAEGSGAWRVNWERLLFPQASGGDESNRTL